jgi:hypothetical protein
VRFKPRPALTSLVTPPIVPPTDISSKSFGIHARLRVQSPNTSQTLNHDSLFQARVKVEQRCRAILGRGLLKRETSVHSGQWPRRWSRTTCRKLRCSENPSERSNILMLAACRVLNLAWWSSHFPLPERTDWVVMLLLESSSAT